MPWDEGKGTVEALLTKGHLERVVADRDIAHQLVVSAQRHLVSAREIQAKDPEGAYAALYDAARKSCAALLQAQGLRPTRIGGHIAVREAVVAQFGSLTGGEVLRPFDRLRRRRHEMEYPSGMSTVDDAEVSEAIDRAKAMVDFADNLIESLPVY